jgi:hypothetical protein
MAEDLASALPDRERDWTFAAALCRTVANEVSAVVRRAVDAIRAELPEYSSVDRADQEEMVRGQYLGLLEGLANHELPGPAQADHAHLLGALRAKQGIAVEALLGAYHVGYREMWNVLLVRAQAEDPEQAGRLLELVNLLWAWLRLTTGAAADGYAETVQAREQARISLEHQFVESLYAGQATAESTALAARAMDFDPHGVFQVICCPAEPWSTQDLDLLKRRLRPHAGASISIVRGTALVIVFQGIPASRILGLLGHGDTQVTAGVGLARPGLTGAAESVMDAERALALAEHRGGVADFSRDWLASTILPHMDRLRPLTDAGHAAEQPHLRDAIRAYSSHGFSITASAQALHIHPNTMKYRLDRWQQLTSWDPRTLDGLVRSLLSITFPPGQTHARP